MSACGGGRELVLAARIEPPLLLDGRVTERAGMPGGSTLRRADEESAEGGGAVERLPREPGGDALEPEASASKESRRLTDSTSRASAALD